MPDAAVVAIHAINRGHRDKDGKVDALQVRKTWKGYAVSAGIPVEEDPEILRAEKDRAIKAAMADFGYDDE